MEMYEIRIIKRSIPEKSGPSFQTYNPEHGIPMYHEVEESVLQTVLTQKEFEDVRTMILATWDTERMQNG